jgi:hypothetical protein
MHSIKLALDYINTIEGPIFAMQLQPEFTTAPQTPRVSNTFRRIRKWAHPRRYVETSNVLEKFNEGHVSLLQVPCDRYFY